MLQVPGFDFASVSYVDCFFIFYFGFIFSELFFFICEFLVVLVMSILLQRGFESSSSRNPWAISNSRKIFKLFLGMGLSILLIYKKSEFRPI